MAKFTRYFYRIENESKVGPYLGNTGTNWTDWIDFSKESSRTPPIEEECVYNKRHNQISRKKVRELLENKECIFGFYNLDQLKSWFSSKELNALSKLGFKIKRVKGRLVAYSDTQCMFKRV